eukprot:Em0023g703a
MAEGFEDLTLQQAEDQGFEGTENEKAADSLPTSDSSKKRFLLRDELAEVRTLLDSSTYTAEERCAALHKKYQQLARDYKRLEKSLVQCQRKQLEVTHNRDLIQNECVRVNLAKSKLESLCRELQKHSKTVAEESKQRAKEEEERRKEVSAKFQSTINEITVKMQEHHQRNQILKEENCELAAKLKQLVEQYEGRENHFEKILKQKQLELQLSETKLAQQSVTMAEEKEHSLAERQCLLVETLEQQKRCELLTQQEMDLRGQLAMYSEKFEEFQQALSKSNDVFGTFKKEMDKMSKTIATLDKESTLWKSRYEKCNKSLLDVSEERTGLQQNIQTLKAKNDKLEKLCRALQLERAELNKKLKSDSLQGSEVPVQSTSEEVKQTSHPESKSTKTTTPSPLDVGAGACGGVVVSGSQEGRLGNAVPESSVEGDVPVVSLATNPIKETVTDVPVVADSMECGLAGSNQGSIVAQLSV